MATIWRLPTVLAESGKSRSAVYSDVQSGLLSRPVKLGPRAAGWPAEEVRAVLAARIAGKTESEIRALVDRLHAARLAAA